MEKIKAIAESVFLCLQSDLKNFKHTAHEQFPISCCHIASSILYKTLINEGISNFDMIRGTDADYFHHVWLEGEDYIIDLTAHQFDGYKTPLILIRMEDFPFNKQPYYPDVEILELEDDWVHFNLLYPEFSYTFYNKYYKL